MQNRLPLARTLRPSTFQALHGHTEVKKALLSTLQPLKHHAFLLIGDRGLGKTTIGRLIAQLILCQNPTSGDSCGQCSSCTQIGSNRHPDVLEIDAASNSKVEETREIIANCSLAPLHGKYKVYLIDEVHMLSTHSFNALLKTLEEPPEHVVFILATTHDEKIPTTVRSRCLKFFLQKPDNRTLTDYLLDFCQQRSIEYDDEIVQVLIDQADGSYRDLLNIVEYSLALSGQAQLNNKELLQIFSHLSQDVFSNIVKHLLSSDIDMLREQLEAILSKNEFCPKKFTQQFLNYLSRQENFSASTPGLYTEISKIYTSLPEHPDPTNFVLMSLLRISLLIAKKKATRSQKA